MSAKRSSVCVIGAGLAGGVVAATLATRGHEVTLVEHGDEPAPLLPAGESWEGTEVKSPFTRGSGIGGTSNFWHGGLTVLDKTDIEGIPNSPIGARAPISYQELRHYYAKAMTLLRGEASFSLDDIENPLEEPLDGFGNLAGDFRLKALLYPKKHFSTRSLIRAVQRTHGLQVVPNTRIRRLVSAGGRRIERAEGINIHSGQIRNFVADEFIVCAGGLGSPKILLQSRESCPQIAGKTLGRHLIDHPTGFVFKAQLRRRMNLRPLFGVTRQDATIRYGFTLKQDRLEQAEYRNHVVYLRPALSMKDPGAYDYLKRKLVTYRWKSIKPLDAFRLVTHADLLFDAVNFRYGLFASTRHVSGLVFAEQFPDEFAQIHRLDRGRFHVKWQVSDKDCRSLEKFIALFFEQFAGQFEKFEIFPRMGTRLDTAGHHSGGCRMASNSNDGVVDGNLRVFGVDNLSVVDGSALPYSGHANTGLTIVALALKCCDVVTAS